MNLPNKLTLLRFVLTAIMVVIMGLRPPGWWHWCGLGLFLIASLTDFLDGYLARKLDLRTDFGALMDPLADKVLVCAAFILFVELGSVASWMVIVIVTRELLVTGLRVLAASRQITLAADSGGKLKTVLQIAAVILLFLGAALEESGGADSWLTLLTSLSLWAAVGLTVWSAGVYLWRNRSLYLDEK